ncbi:hypothetical protein BDR26DRAFT_862206 [Obelidium mucronatum]|nr:hypothetical protein BDR26DRAFT_862206 [Obelidium mucronatum]
MLGNQQQLPAELITQILLHPQISLLDIRTVSQTSRRMREIVANPSFGARFFAMDTPSLSLDISLETDISTFDVLYYGISHREENELLPYTVFLVHVMPESQQVQLLKWKLSTSGRLQYSKENKKTGNDGLWICNLWQKTPNGIASSSPTGRKATVNGHLAARVSATHLSKCTVCSSVNAQWTFEPIDKNYRVFLKSWSDSLAFSLPSKARVDLRIAASDYPFQESNVARYGLRTSQIAVKAVEEWFGFASTDNLCEKDAVEDKEAEVVSEMPIRVYNPWM